MTTSESDATGAESPQLPDEPGDGRVVPAAPPPRKVAPASAPEWTPAGLAIHGVCTVAVIAGLIAGVWWPVVTAFVIETVIYVARSSG